jgi:hypothetical protein
MNALLLSLAKCSPIGKNWEVRPTEGPIEGKLYYSVRGDTDDGQSGFIDFHVFCSLYDTVVNIQVGIRGKITKNLSQKWTIGDTPKNIVFL